MLEFLSFLDGDIVDDTYTESKVVYFFIFELDVGLLF
jgi:hypothetical protein